MQNNLNFYDIFIKSFDINLKLKSSQKNDKNSESQTHEDTFVSPIVFEISKNASKFAVFSAIRSLVLEHETKYKNIFKSEKVKSNQLEKSKSNDEDDTKTIDFDNKQNIPYIVSAGIQTLFDIISETKVLYPSICSKALSSLYDIFQGQDPESFKTEPDALFQSLYDLLLDLATHSSASPQKSSESNDEMKNWCSIACSVLLGLIVARGDTGKIIKAVTSILMSTNNSLNQQIKLPEILIKLQKSVECASLGKLERPTFFEHGIPQNSIIDEFFVKNISSDSTSPSLAADGKYLYILLGKSIYKIGSGYNGTTRGFVYKINKDFSKDKRGWIGFCKDKLYYKKISKRNNDSFMVIDRESLTLSNTIQVTTKPFKKDFANYTLYSDGESINAIHAIKDDNFVIKEIISQTDYSYDLTLNLAKRSFRTLGYAAFEEEILNSTQLQKIQSSYNCFIPTLPDDSEVNGIVSGKEFGLVVTSAGKVYYYGKSASIGLKSLIKSPSLKLSELTISKVSKIIQISLGHDGLHALLLSDDGSVYFTGTVRRGEDGEISKRRLLKPSKPKRISRLDNHFILNVSSNNGTSAFVTKTGKLIMFGKDTSFCDAHGIVSQLQDQQITKIALGKAHSVALNSKGQVFTFGVNNKGQCGRSFSRENKERNLEGDSIAKAAPDRSLTYLCEIDEHEIIEENCRICKICHECTGYNKSCAAIQRVPMKNRIPGSNCFCGHGDAGCMKCGACSLCISKQENNSNNVSSDRSSFSKESSKKEVRINVEDFNYSNDLERDAQRVAHLAPAKITIPSSSPVVQVACGLHHTVLLTLAGEVYTFGSNQYGQLGTGDLQPVASPIHVKIPGIATQVAAGSNHTAVLTTKGVVYTFGNYQKGQLGRLPNDIFGSNGSPASVNTVIPGNPVKHDIFINLNECQTDSASSILAQRQRFLWNCSPGPISGIGPNYRKKACWITASGDQTFVKIDESLVNVNSLAKINIAADRNTIIFISSNEGVPGCITINKQDGKCKTHINNQYLFNNCDYDNIYDDMNFDLGCSSNSGDRFGKDNNDFHQTFSSSSSSSPSNSITPINNTVFTIDPLYDVLWCFDVTNRKVMCFNILASKTMTPTAIYKSDITLPKKNVLNVTRSHACLNVLASLDTLARAQNVLDYCFEAESKLKSNKPSVSSESTIKESKESRKICRFEAFGGGWGYFGHSVEAIRFMCDTDIVMDGIGLYGGRGEYTCKIKIYDLGIDGGGYEKEGTLIFEIEEIPYYCPARTIHNIFFPRAINVIAGKWYLMWVKISGPSSDCGSSGQNIVVGEDQVVFTFKSSKKSNNGTDINSGQIPSILYRVIANDRKLPETLSKVDEICKISKNFINTISSESFENLVKLLNWSWSQFKSKTLESNEKFSSNDELLLNRFVYICQVCLRLLKKYINEIYPSESFKYNENDKTTYNKNNQNEISKLGEVKVETAPTTSKQETLTAYMSSSRKTTSEKINLAESIGNVKSLLIQILSDDAWNIHNQKTTKMYFSILDECNDTFVSCFNAFYPTSYLKWDCLCSLLSQMDKGLLHSRLLSGILAGLCDPTVNLKSTFSIMSPCAEQKSITSPSDNYGYPILQSSDSYHYPILVEQMMYRTQKEKVNVTYSNWTFKDILTRLLDIISRPIRLKIENIYSNSKLDFYSNEYLKKTSNFNLISNCSYLLSKILAEIVYQSCTADTETTVISPYSLQSTGIRFKKCDYSKTWNTGSFGSDAICFTVDRPGIVLAGCCVYYGSGSYEYQLELLHDTLDSKSQLQHKWEILETAFGSFDQDNVHRNMVQIKFERPVPLKENACYAIRYCSQGARTCSGDSGYPSVRGPCGTVFRFYPCDLSFNGTTPARGQIPSLLYYSVPMNYQNSKMKNCKEIFARDISLEIASDIIYRSRDLLILARNAFLYSLSSSSDKSSSISSNTTQAFDSEHNITPIEEHFDVSWMTPCTTVISTPSHQGLSGPFYTSNTKDSGLNTAKDITKRIETFSRGLIETLKFDKKIDKNCIDFVEVDVAAKELTPNDILNDETSSRKRSGSCTNDINNTTLNGNRKIISNQLSKSESEESLQNIVDNEKVNEIFTIQESSLFHTLLPLTVAHMSRLICSDPKVSVEILGLVKSILPHISSWNQIFNKNLTTAKNVFEKTAIANNNFEVCTTSNYYTILESDHPYKSTCIYSFKVEFPTSVKWMSIEFDPQCGTSQPEDCLKIFIPPNLNQSDKNTKTEEKTKVKVQKNVTNLEKDHTTSSSDQNILIKKFNTETGWSTNAIIVPGNEIYMALETASNYLLDHKLNRYGFKCILIGYENIDTTNTFNSSLISLESEFTYLGGMCSANLMRKDLIFSDEKSDDFWATENTLKKHSVLLSKGLSIQNGTLTINNILEYDIAIDSEQSHEKQFLKDFVFVTPDSAGGRLASWIQPESRLDPNRCELKLFQDPIQSGWPTKLVIETRDQYGEIVYVPNIQIQLKVALSSNFSNEKRYNKLCKDPNIFLPLGKVNYEPVVKDKEKICLKSITAMKAYSQYSFEELRLYTPIQNKTSDVMTATDLGDQSYSVVWTPEYAGSYIINIIIDGIQTNEIYNVTVIDADVPPPVKEHALKKIQPQYKYRKFYAEYTSGLRIRLHPTLQAEQIGVIKVNDIISFVDELENGDGVWIKLSSDSIRKYCSTAWYPTEAWCLQYNQHLEKRLLFPLIESTGLNYALDEMNNVKYFDENESSIQDSQLKIELNVGKNEQVKLDDGKRLEESVAKLNEDKLKVQENLLNNQSNITAAIAGVVEGGANKLQAFQKWLKRDSIGDTTVKKRIGSIPEAYNNNTLDLKNTKTDNIDDKLSNDINLSSPVEDNIIPTNTNFNKKVNQNEVYVFRDTKKPQSSQKINKNSDEEDNEEANTPKQALSPSIAETIRAIFAAFLWHEGLVHDSIACASFLKFHPTIPKTNIYSWEKSISESLTKEEKIQQRHSVEIANTSNYLNARPSTLEALTKSGYCCVHYRKQRGKINEHSNDFKTTTDDWGSQYSGLPPALRCLVFVWDELNKDFQSFICKTISEKESKDIFMLAKAGLQSQTPEITEFDHQKKTKTKKLIDESNTPLGASPSTLGTASVEKDDSVWCELCKIDIDIQFQPNQLTQHMKNSHPGCGESAKGRGYNSNGVYCEGWAGKCGEEGVGATSWYLLCDQCREKYFNTHRRSGSVGESVINKTPNSKDFPIEPPVVTKSSIPTKKLKYNSTMNMECFDNMKENALFLLDLNSHNGGILNKTATNNLIPSKTRINNRHSSVTELIPQPNTSNFQQRLSIVNNLSDDQNGQKKIGIQKQNSNSNYCIKKNNSILTEASNSVPDLLWTPPEGITCLDLLNAKINEAGSYNVFNLDKEKQYYDNPFITNNNNIINQFDNGQDFTNNYENKFHRSFSMIQGWGLYSFNPNEKDVEVLNYDYATNNRSNNTDQTKVILRRKKQCLCDSGSEASLLNFPSKNLKKLVPENLLNPPLKTFKEVSSSHDLEKEMENALEIRSQSGVMDLFSNNSQGKSYSFLSRPTINFIFEKHDLDKLRYLLRKNLRKSICSVYGLQALNWLLRTVTQPMCVHDIMWWFVSSLVQTKNDGDNVLKLEDSDVSYEHPVAISNVDDRIQQLLSQSLHLLLQSIADITLYLPAGSALQRLAIQCFGIKFKPSDHQFLHNSHVFGNISKILSKSEEFNEENLFYSTNGYLNAISEHPDDSGKSKVNVYNHVDITDVFEFIISSRQAMINALTDNSTETFWESDDEDRNKPKIIEISMMKPNYVCKSINIHIDNCRDLAHKITSFTVYGGASLGELNCMETVETESNIGSWYSVAVKDELNTHFRIELRGLENNIRIRQIKLLGYSLDFKANQEQNLNMKKYTNAHYIQQKYCELETLRVFRVLTNQVFGKLITTFDRPISIPMQQPPSLNNLNSNPGLLLESHMDSPSGDSLDLREHMVGILFSRSKLTHLQKQIIVHIVDSIKKETCKLREEWEYHINSSTVLKSNIETPIKSNDVYCFEMLSMVSALSGSTVGRSYLSHQMDLIKDLFILLHTGSERVQRQVTLLLRRILPEISPETLSNILDVDYQPEKDITTLLQNPKPLNHQQLGIIDILLAIIAKSLQIQVKFKNNSNIINNKNMNAKLNDYIVPTPLQSANTSQKFSLPHHYQHQLSSGTEVGSTLSGSSKDYDSIDKSVSSILKEERKRWFLCGSASTKLAENIISLIRDMGSGKLSDKWTQATKTAVAECIINLAHLDEVNRQPDVCLKTPTLWLALASLCVLDEDHVIKLSSGQWSKSGDMRPLCINHDDSVTNAVIECNECGTLCCDCDRFLHLNRKTWIHRRTVCKEEEESIKVELHESCGRIKLFWLLGLADSKTLKGLIEFRDGHNIIICDPQNAVGRCRFCGIYGNTGLLAVGNVCVEQQCQEYSANACSKIHSCGHFCGGIVNEQTCLPCLHQKCQSITQQEMKKPRLTQDVDDMCMICFTEALSCAPSIQLSCGHVFHHHCCQTILQKRWNGARISFAFSQCPICKNDIYHDSLVELLEPINALKDDVKRKAIMRLRYEGIDKEIIDEQKNLAIHAMERYAYYVCCKCQKAYYGGEARCDAELGENFNPEELVCGGCSDIAKAQMCPKHGMDFLEYKCRYCCSVAVFFCFGTTHFCDTCHDDFQRLTNIPKIKLPKCPVGPKAIQLMGDECPLHIVHPPTGEEFALGCGICRNFHTF